MSRSFIVLLSILMLFTTIKIFATNQTCFTGPYFSDGTVFYLIHKGGPLTLDIRLLKSNPGYRGMPALKTTPTALLTLFNPEEKMVAKKYWKVTNGETEKKYNFHFPEAEAGIWQIRNTFATNCNMTIDFETKPKLKYGVLFSRCRILDEDVSKFKTTYFLVPPYDVGCNQKSTSKTSKLHIANRGYQTECYDANGRKIVFCDTYSIFGARPDFFGNSNIDLPFGSTEIQRHTIGPTVEIFDKNKKCMLKLLPDSNAVIELRKGDIYQLAISKAGQGYLTMDGFPIILCPDKKTAQQINGSMNIGPDGNYYPHKFQVRMLKWLNSLKPSDLTVEAIPIAKYRKEWLANPQNAELLPTFTFAKHLLKSQQTDPTKADFGSSPIKLADLAILYSLDRPFNPYYGNKAIMNRTLLYFFRDMLKLTESGAMIDNPDIGRYCGGTEWSGWEAMAFHEDYTALALLGKKASPELMNLWVEALRHQVHRFWNTRLSCENQSLHWPLKLYALHMATKDPMYQEMAQDYLKDMADPELSRAMKTGYPMEAFGLDGTYTGLSTSMLSFAARLSGDDAALPILKKTFSLMSHSVVREPDGTLNAANGFAHRTVETWLKCQYGGGIPLLADKLEDAAVLHKTTPELTIKQMEDRFDKLSKVKFPADFKQWCKTKGKALTKYSLCSFKGYWPYAILNLNKPIENPKLPIEKKTSFEKNFNNEFLAKRTPAYYTFFYTGNYSWRRHHWRYFDTPFAPKSGIENGNIVSNHFSRTWMPIQGLNIFWTPKFGAFLLARNWTMYSQNLVRAERKGNVVDFPVCWSAVTTYDSPAQTLTTTHKSKNLALNIKRITQFKENSLSVALTISAAEKIKPVELIEQIPFPLKKGLKFSYFTHGKWQSATSSNVTKIRASMPNGGGILLTFSKPADIRSGFTSYAACNPGTKIGLCDIVIAADFDGKTPINFNYTIEADDKNE